MKGFFPILFLVVILGILSPFIFFMVNETEQAVVLQLGKPVHVVVNRARPGEYDKIAEEIRSATEATVSISQGPGLYWRLPFIQTVEKLDARIVEFDEQPRDIVTVDKYQLRIDSYARWRIRDPLLFYLRLRRVETAEVRLRAIVGSQLRQELGRQSHYEIIRSSTKPLLVMGVREGEYETYPQRVRLGREVLMARITKSSDESARKIGIEVIDVRIKRADLPQENAESVYRRMIEERNRIANRYRMEGDRESNIIRSDTDRQVKVILSEAEKERLEIRGRADAEAAGIYWEGYEDFLEDGSMVKIEGFGADPEFFKFYRSLEALKKSVGGSDRLILTTENPLFEIFTPQGLQPVEP